jgi:hypothetical protein
MSQMFIQLIERLAEMFPKQNYQTKLEAYIASKYPQNAADVDRLQQEYTYRQQGTWI